MGACSCKEPPRSSHCERSHSLSSKRSYSLSHSRKGMKCAYCNKPGAAHPCPQCRSTFYCGRKCRKADSNVHDLFCWIDADLDPHDLELSPANKKERHVHEIIREPGEKRHSLEASAHRARTSSDSVSSLPMPLKGCLKKKQNNHDPHATTKSTKHVWYENTDETRAAC
mmetsp:Transcript_40908/g.79662  ORF Transcript_40908/g.79662 Transcript_40908/m.79662 type:complete len:169 (-) Transcript_40908:173-679(-)